MGINLFENKPFRVYSADCFIDSNIVTGVGAYFITDKQLLFKSYLRNEEDDGRDMYGHPKIFKEIDEKIYDDNEMNPNTNRRPYNIYIYMSKNYYSGYMQFLISLPETGYISLSEYIFLSNVLDELDEFNKYRNLSEDKCKYISILKSDKDYEDLNVIEAKRVIRGCTIGHQNLHKEKMIGELQGEDDITGEVLSEDDIIRVISYYIDFSKCNDFNDLLNMMNLCDRYYNDSYYHDFFVKIFPNYLATYNIVDKINRLNIDNIIISGLSFDNIYETLNNIYNRYSSTFSGIKR